MTPIHVTLSIGQMDDFRDQFGADPRTFARMPQRCLWDIVESIDTRIDAVVDDDATRELFLTVQGYALQLLEWLPPNDSDPAKPTVQLTGTDGNVFAIIGTVKRALASHDFEHGTDLATEFVNRAFAAQSYDEVLRLTMEYVNVR